MDLAAELTPLKSNGFAEDPFDPVAVDRRSVTSPDQDGVAELVAGIGIGGKKRPGQLLAFFQQTADLSA